MDIEIRKWHIIDLYWRDKDEHEVDKLIKKYVDNGWSNEGNDYAGNKDYDNCTQLMKWDKIIEKKLK